MTIFHVVSMSGGKDSTATAILALHTMPRESLRFVFADTGNEHEATIEYVDYLRGALEIDIETIRVSFTDEIAGKRRHVQEQWPRKGVSAEDCERALSVLHPTGNPYLDLCLWKGRFPATKSAFCTLELKTKPLAQRQIDMIDNGECKAVWSWQGVRVDESHSRRRRLACPVNAAFDKRFEEQGAGIYTYRPILRWSAEDCFEAHRMAGIEPNPLYKQGMGRVGCMPCINAGKDEVLEISKRFPEHIERIAEWERLVGLASKCGVSGFFPNPDNQRHLNKQGVKNVVEWSKTKRGGQLMDFIRINEEPAACSSAYGLCE